MGLLNTLQATCPKCGRHLARWSWAESRPRFKCYVGACAAKKSAGFVGTSFWCPLCDIGVCSDCANQESSTFYHTYA